uniref:t-SNARE coiled-coil homology domain-containing protein n=1 Tax=Romanomermis culicivorax TaxID=13658 RepID=A0A915I9M4_ROMCU
MARKLDNDNEIGGIRLKCNQITDESLESTRRMMEYCEGSKEAAIRTLVMLDDQGEQLERVEGGLDTINQDMKEAEEHLKGMEKCCGLCFLPCFKPYYTSPIGAGPRRLHNVCCYTSAGVVLQERVPVSARSENFDWVEIVKPAPAGVCNTKYSSSQDDVSFKGRSSDSQILNGRNSVKGVTTTIQIILSISARKNLSNDVEFTANFCYNIL